MRVVLDECVPERFRKHLTEHEAHSARFAGLSGKKNGELLRLAGAAGYDVLFTVDPEHHSCPEIIEFNHAETTPRPGHQPP
jgi:hypothetical protein